MPYYISDNNPDCPQWAVEKEDGEVIACHDTKESAIDQMVALSIEEGIEPAGERSESRAINQAPPAYMRSAARRGLEYYEQGLAGDGLTPRTVREARAMAAGDVSDDKWIRIAAWIARHMPDLDAPQNSDSDDPQYPGAGLVAHLLWGSGPSKAAAERAMAYAEGVVARIRAEENRMAQMDEKRTRWTEAAR